MKKLNQKIRFEIFLCFFVVGIIITFILTISGCGTGSNRTTYNNYHASSSTKSPLKIKFKIIDLNNIKTSSIPKIATPTGTNELVLKVYPVSPFQPIESVISGEELAKAEYGKPIGTSIYNIPIGQVKLTGMILKMQRPDENDENKKVKDIIVMGLTSLIVYHESYTSAYLGLIKPIQSAQTIEPNFPQTGMATINITPYLPEYPLEIKVNLDRTNYSVVGSVEKNPEELAPLETYIVALVLNNVYDESNSINKNDYLNQAIKVFSDILKPEDSGGIFLACPKSPNSGFNYSSKIIPYTEKEELSTLLNNYELEEKNIFENLQYSDSNPMIQSMHEIIENIKIPYRGKGALILIAGRHPDDREKIDILISKANEKSVSISVIAVDGEAEKLTEYQRIVQATGGSLLYGEDIFKGERKDIIKNLAGITLSLIQGALPIKLTFTPIPKVGDTITGNIKIRYSHMLTPYITPQIDFKLKIPSQ